MPERVKVNGKELDVMPEKKKELERDPRIVGRQRGRARERGRERD